MEKPKNGTELMHKDEAYDFAALMNQEIVSQKEKLRKIIGGIDDKEWEERIFAIGPLDYEKAFNAIEEMRHMELLIPKETVRKIGEIFDHLSVLPRQAVLFALLYTNQSFSIDNPEAIFDPEPRRTAEQLDARLLMAETRLEQLKHHYSRMKKAMKKDNNI